MGPTLSFPLEDFESAVLADGGLLGMLYSGFLGRGTADRYSDLDIEVWIRDDMGTQLSGKLRQVLGRLGPVRFSYPRGEGFVTGFVGDEWQRVDLYLKRLTDFAPSPDYSEARVVKDTDGVLTRLVAESPREHVAPTLEEARAVIDEAIDSQVYLALHNARGATWSALGEVSYQLARAYTLLAQVRGRHSYGFRYVELLLSPAEEELLSAALPTVATRSEVRRAARVLWMWTRYVWDEAERVLGGPLGVEVDETELLLAVDRIYSRD